MRTRDFVSGKLQERAAGRAEKNSHLWLPAGAALERQRSTSEVYSAHGSAPSAARGAAVGTGTAAVSAGEAGAGFSLGSQSFPSSSM